MNIKKELKTFFIWLRNGICFTVTWFLILSVITWTASGIKEISLNKLTDLLLWSSGGVLIFCLVFTNIFIRKLGFTPRLTIFMIIFSIYEVAFFYHIGIFIGFGYIYQWVLFFFLITPLYLICLAIYSLYRKKKGELYTVALHKYQQERKAVNE